MSTRDSAKNSPELEERTAVFGESVIKFAKNMPNTPLNSTLISELVATAAKVGATYAKTDSAGSSKEFRYRIRACKRRAKETKHWLRMAAAAIPEQKHLAIQLWQEANDLYQLFDNIFQQTRRKRSDR